MQEADKVTTLRGMKPTDTDTFAVEFEVKPLKEPVTILGYEMEIQEPQQQGGRPRMQRTDKKKTYTIPYFADFQPKRSVTFPAAYLIAVPVPEVLHTLQMHGITVERLLQPVILDVELFQVNEITGAARLYQGHRINTVQGEYKTETKEFPIGSLIVHTAQPLANLAAYLLEPESDDGLLVWNFFDRYLVPQWSRTPQIYPAYKLFINTPLVTEIIR